jgi:hypothetical protein
MASMRSVVRNQYLAKSVKWPREPNQAVNFKGQGEESEKELWEIEGKGDNRKGWMQKTKGD